MELRAEIFHVCFTPLHFTDYTISWRRCWSCAEALRNLCKSQVVSLEFVFLLPSYPKARTLSSDKCYKYLDGGELAVGREFSHLNIAWNFSATWAGKQSLYAQP